MSLLQHHKSDLAVLDISGRHGATSQSFNRRPVGHEVFVGLKLGREFRFQDAILSLVAVRDLKRNALFYGFRCDRRNSVHRRIPFGVPDQVKIFEGIGPIAR